MKTPAEYAALAEAELAQSCDPTVSTEAGKMAARRAQALATLAQTAATLAAVDSLGPLLACVQHVDASSKASLRVMATNGFA